MTIEKLSESGTDFPLDDTPEIDTYDQLTRRVQELHTQVYLEMGYISKEDLNEEGLFIDYAERSHYFMVDGERRLSACRYIRADKKDGLLSLPTAKHFSIDADALRQAAGVEQLSSLKYDEVIEVSALVSIRHLNSQENDPTEALDPTKRLYGSVVRESLEHGYKVWLLNIGKLLLRSLAGILGEDQVHVLGESQAYMGPPTTPVAINPYEVVRSTFHDESDYGEVKRAYLREALQGIDSTHIPADIRQIFDEHGIDYTSCSVARNLGKLILT